MSNKKVVKLRKRRNINIGIVVFLIMFLYIAINVYIYFTKEHLSIYKVQAGTTAEDNLISGLILRDEHIVSSVKAGYISYLQKEGARVSKNTSVYSVDDSRQVFDVITSGEYPIKISKENSAQIKHEIHSFQASFTNDDFELIYDFKEDAQRTVIDLLNTAMIEQGQTILEETGYANSYEMYPSQSSGIITYYIDSYESITLDTVSSAMFQKDTYERTSLRTKEMITQDSPVYKLVTSEIWSIVLPLTMEQYQKLADKEQITCTIIKDDLKLTAKLSLFQKGSDYFGALTLDKHLSNYLSERYLDIKLDFGTVEGLKIPLTSIIEKDFYLVPLEYFTKGADSKNTGLTKEIDNQTEVTYVFVPTDIYYQDDTYAYVDGNQFSLGTWIHKDGDRYKLSQMNKLTGVYNVNLGYAVFKRIEILYQNDEYSIIKKNTSNGLSVNDHIALDGTTAVEQKIIY